MVILIAQGKQRSTICFLLNFVLRCIHKHKMCSVSLSSIITSFLCGSKEKTYFDLSKQTKRPENRFKSKSVVAWHFRWFGAKNQLSIFVLNKSLQKSKGKIFLSKFQLNHFQNWKEKMELENISYTIDFVVASIVFPFSFAYFDFRMHVSSNTNLTVWNKQEIKTIEIARLNVFLTNCDRTIV